MTRKEYLLKIENLIVNKLKYHAPILNSDDIDYSLIDAVGIDTALPIFIYRKPLDKLFFAAFYSVKKKCDFNLILTAKPLVKDRRIKLLKNTYVLLEDSIGSELSHAIDALNINYLAHSDYENITHEEYLKFNDKVLEFEYIPYYFTKKIMDKGVIFQATNFILNGKNYILNITNTLKNMTKMSFEINIPLPRGYYFFKHGKDFVEIENLTSKEKAYFNYHFKDASITFSNMNGIESCTYACVNLKCEINLLPKQNKKLYFNFGENKYCIYSPNDMQYFFNLSQQKLNEIFDLKVTTSDKQKDQLFNFYLPRNIYSKWQNFDVDEKSENDYIKMRNLYVKKSEKGEQINQDIKGLKEVKFYRNSKWKRVFILHNSSCYMFADKVKYFNYTLLTNEIFNKNNEIYLSFASY